MAYINLSDCQVVDCFMIATIILRPNIGYWDNRAAIAFMKISKYHRITKHIDIIYFAKINKNK